MLMPERLFKPVTVLAVAMFVLTLVFLSTVCGGTAVGAAPQSAKSSQQSFKQAVLNQDLTRVISMINSEPALAASSECLEQAGLLQAFYFDQHEALILLSRAQSIDRHNPHLLCSLAYGLTRSGKAPLALDLLQQALNKSADDRRTLAVKAYALAQTGETLASDRLVARLLAKPGKSLSEDSLMLLRVRVLILLDSLKESEALDLIDNAIKAEPDSIALRMLRAQTLRPLGKWQTSVQDLKKILSINPVNEFAQRTLADVYRQHGMFAEGAKCYRLFLETNPHASKIVVGNRGLAICLEALKQFGQAANCRLAVLEVNPSWLKLLAEQNSKSKTTIGRELALDIYAYASALRTAGQARQCLVPLNILLKHFPRQKAALEERALAYEALKQYKECKQDLDLLIMEQPDYPRFYSERARIYKALGDNTRAAQDQSNARALELK